MKTGFRVALLGAGIATIATLVISVAVGVESGTLAAVAVAGATIALVIVTWAYVTLTNDLSRHAAVSAEAATEMARMAQRELQVRELQLIASELPAVFHSWVRTIVNMHPNPDEAHYAELSEEEIRLRMTLQSLRNRLPVNDDYIATEIDRAIDGYIRWTTDQTAELDHPPHGKSLPEGVKNPLIAANIFVTANLPGRIRELIETGSYEHDLMNNEPG